MRNITKKILIYSGLLMILAALSLCAYNVVKDKKAYKRAVVYFVAATSLVMLLVEMGMVLAVSRNSERKTK